MGKEWIKIKEIGQLYLEKILVTFDIPILFICVDYENRKYLCLNIDDESGKTIIVETDNKHLIDMLNNKITMESVFREAIDEKAFIVEYDSDNDKIITSIEATKNISDDMLPKKDAYLELTNDSIKEYISYLNKQLIKIRIEDFSEKKLYIIQQYENSIDFDVDNVSSYNCETVMLMDIMKNCSYNINNIMIA